MALSLPAINMVCNTNGLYKLLLLSSLRIDHSVLRESITNTELMAIIILYRSDLRLVFAVEELCGKVGSLNNFFLGR